MAYLIHEVHCACCSSSNSLSAPVKFHIDMRFDEREYLCIAPISIVYGNRLRTISCIINYDLCRELHTIIKCPCILASFNRSDVVIIHIFKVVTLIVNSANVYARPTSNSNDNKNMCDTAIVI